MALFDKKELKETQSIILLTEKCNQGCVFCSGDSRFGGGGEVKFLPKEIIKTIRQEKNSLCFEGGEPTLSPKLLDYVRLAKQKGTKDIILVTNGVKLAYYNYCRKLVDGGVTLFNISFPHSNPKKCDAITRSKGSSLKRCRGIKNLIKLGAADRVRLTFVINRTNYDDAYNFAVFVKRNFPEIFYLAFNFVKILGKVEKQQKLVPRYLEAQPYLLKALKFCRKNKLRFVLDGWPLCLIPGFEESSIDTYFMVNGQANPFLEEKIKTAKCRSCRLGPVCSGIRRDYYDIFGDEELRPSRKSPEAIRRRIKNTHETNRPDIK